MDASRRQSETYGVPKGAVGTSLIVTTIPSSANGSESESQDPQESQGSTLGWRSDELETDEVDIVRDMKGLECNARGRCTLEIERRG